MEGSVIKGLILAAGRGTRLRPLTDCRPKPLVPLAGRPILQYNIENLRDAGVNEIVVVIGHNSQQIPAYFGTGDALGVRLRYEEQEQLLGTAHAVFQAREALEDSPFVLVFGDNMTGYPLSRLTADYRRWGAGSMLAISEDGDPRKQAVVSLDGDQVTLIEERPEVPKSRFTSAGMFVFDPVIFKAIEQIRPVSSGEYYLPHAVQVLIDSGHPVRHSLAEGWRVNINCAADMLRALRCLMEDSAHLPPWAHAWHSSNEVALGADVSLQEDVCLGRYTYVGNDCQIGRNSRIVNSLLMDRVVVGADCVIENAILGNDVVVPDGTHTIGNGEPVVVPDGHHLVAVA